jgi:hypothetical protein
MVDLEQIKVVLQGISTLASLIQLRRDSLEKGEEPTDEQIDSSVSNESAKTDGFDTLIATIQTSTLNAIGEVIERARKRYEDAIRDPANTRQARDAEEQIAQSAICGELKRIKRHKGGSLPTDYDTIWVEFVCA